MSELDYSNYETSELGVRDLIAILSRRRWTLLVTLALSVGVAVVLTHSMTPIYRAQATMLIEQSPQRIGMKLEEGSPIGDRLALALPHPVETQVEVLHSGPLIRRVLKRIAPIPEDAYPSLSADQVKETDIVRVVAESTEPRVARDAANTLVDEYIQQSDYNKVTAIRNAREFVQQRLAEAQTQLAKADARLRDFKEQNHLPDLASNRASAISQADGIWQELRQAENQLISYRSQARQLRTAIGREPAQQEGSHTIAPNPKVESLRADIERLELQRITLLITLKPREPEVREVDQQIARLKQLLRKQPRDVRNGVTYQPNPARATLQGQLDGLETQMRGLEPHVARLRAQYRQARDRLIAFPEWETALSRLQRERDQAEEAQKVLSNQLRELRIWERAQGASATGLTSAGLPAEPVRPRPLMNFLVAVVLGLVFGVGASCLREMMDSRIHTAADAERITALPVLGRVPAFPRREPALISPQAESVVKDSFRRLRAGITLAGHSEPISSLMVTSATAGEGKSTTAANLAMATAIQGRRVILVDADLRDPSLMRLFGARSAPGLSDVLGGGIPLAEALCSTDVPDLLLLPAGSPARNAAELLAGPRMSALVRELSTLADLVILDTPPCLPVADAEVLGSWVDAAVLVVGLGKTDKEAVRLARERLDQAQVRLLGAVMNRMKPDDHGYYYRYGGSRYGNPARSAPAASLPAVTTAVLPSALEMSATECRKREERET